MPSVKGFRKFEFPAGDVASAVKGSKREHIAHESPLYVTQRGLVTTIDPCIIYFTLCATVMTARNSGDKDEAGVF